MMPSSVMRVFKRMPSLGRNVVARRRFLQLSQNDLAEACDVSRRTICRIEQGVVPSVETLMALARALDTTPSKLLDDPKRHGMLTRYLIKLRDRLLLASARTLRLIVRNVRALSHRARTAS